MTDQNQGDAKTDTVICHLAFGPLTGASRLMREVETALESGLAQKILCIGYQEGSAPAWEEPMPGCEIIRLPRANIPFPRLAKRSLQWLFWTFAAARIASRRGVSLVQAHSLAAMPAGAMVKRRLGVPLIYDAHELETERTGWGKAQKAVARLFEAFLIRRADHIFVVGELIADWYQKKYAAINLSLLRNVPRAPKSPVTRNALLRKDLGIPENDQLFLYLGVIDEGRGYQILLDTFRQLPPNQHIVFMGSGNAAKNVANTGLPNVHWHPPVATHDVVRYAAGADVGISLIEDTCLSYRYCLPNKLHEYRLAGLPVIVSNLPEMARLVSQTEAGWIVEPDTKSLRNLIEPLTPGAIADQCAKAARHAPLSWEGEQDHYLEVTRALLSGKR